MLKDDLYELIERIREDGSFEGRIILGGDREKQPDQDSATISLARFQSYRRRTEAALIQELTDYIEECGLTVLYYQVHDDVGIVQLW